MRRRLSSNDGSLTRRKGVAYARTDIGGLYRLNSDDSWTPLLDFADASTWYGHTEPSDDCCLIIQELLGRQCSRK